MVNNLTHVLIYVKFYTELQLVCSLRIYTFLSISVAMGLWILFFIRIYK
jgi:hypothetical protein